MKCLHVLGVLAAGPTLQPRKEGGGGGGGCTHVTHDRGRMTEEGGSRRIVVRRLYRQLLDYPLRYATRERKKGAGIQGYGGVFYAFIRCCASVRWR